MGAHDNLHGWKMSWGFSVLGAFLFLVSSIGAVEPPHLQIPRIDTRISVDGVLDEAEWDSA